MEEFENNVVVAVVSSEQLPEKRTVKQIRLVHNMEFNELLKIKYDNQEEKINQNEEYEFDRVVSFGLDRLKKEETGYELIHNGKKAEKRILKNLGKITFQLLQINSYPRIDASTLSLVLNKSLKNMCNRTINDYRKTVLYYCNVSEDEIERCKDSLLGELNVSGFVKRVPRLYVTNNSI